MDSKNLPITGPCPIDLDAIGFDRRSKRSHCGHCEKNVHVLSNMTEREARAFMSENAGKNLCVSYARRKDGTVQFKPEPPTQLVPLGRLSRRPAAAAAGLGLAVALAACTPHGDPPRDDPKMDDIEVVDGGIEMKEPCDKPKKPDAHRESLEMVEGEAPIREPEAIPLAGDMMVPEPPPEPPPKVDQVEGKMEIAPQEPQAEIHARGSRQVLHFDD
ncbi:MAG: hypothetical protein ACRBN8_27145 [Nannocystales bacterium]